MGAHQATMCYMLEDIEPEKKFSNRIEVSETQMLVCVSYFSRDIFSCIRTLWVMLALIDLWVQLQKFLNIV